MKKVLALIIAVIFTLTLTVFAFAAETKGTISKIDGNKITVKDEAGKESTIEGDAKGLKVGDKVTIKDGKIVKPKKKAIEGC
ncbi:MAG: hypothetical protein N3A62_10110 [Thermodesulfovibrionales bacterium]|nr:hypothetical protein [Thermodesulfovibrionales bacterium]